MFQSAEIGHKLGKSVFKREEPKLRHRLLDLQHAVLEKAAFPVIVRCATSIERTIPSIITSARDAPAASARSAADDSLASCSPVRSTPAWRETRTGMPLLTPPARACSSMS